MNIDAPHPFDVALTLQSDAPGHYLGEAPAAYWNMVGPFGGITAAVLVRAVFPHPDVLGEVLSLNANYGSALAAGAYEVHALPVRTNRSTQHWTLSILQAGVDGSPVVTITGTAVTAVRRNTWGTSDMQAPVVLLPHQVPKAQPDFDAGWLQRYELRPVEGDLPPVWDGSGEHSLSPVWMRDAPPRPLDVCSLAALADVFFPRVWLRRAHQVPAGTVSMTVYFHATTDELAATGDGYLLGQARAGVSQRVF